MIVLHTYKGTRYLTSELLQIAGINRTTFLNRLRSGWSIEEAVETPSRKWVRKERADV